MDSTSFKRIGSTTNIPLASEVKSTTYFRTIAHTLQNVSTSAWITDDYYIMPFWPASLEAPPFGPILSTHAQTWQAVTTVVTSELDCQPMTVDRKH